MAKHTLSEIPVTTPSPAVILKPQKANLFPGDRLPVVAPAGDSIEPTLQLEGKDYFEIDLNRASDRQVLELAKLYSGSRIPRKLAKKFALNGQALIPFTWVRGAA